MAQSHEDSERELNANSSITRLSVADWITQKELALLLGCSQRSASIWAAAGKLRRYEHGVPACGRKKYSRQLVELDIRRRLEEAVRRQDEDAGA